MSSSATPTEAHSSIKKRPTFPSSFSELITTQLIPGNMAKSQALQSNLGIDYVVVFRFATTGIVNLEYDGV